MGGVPPPQREAVPASGSPDPTPARADLRRRRSQLQVMGGLLLSFCGILLYGLQLPIAPALLDRIAPWLAVGFLAAWSSGILAGNSQVRLPQGARPALRGQVGLAGLAAVAGALSAAVVVQHVGPYVALAGTSVAEVTGAVAGATVVWLGGYLMGNGMHRFVRRRGRRLSRPSMDPASER